MEETEHDARGVQRPLSVFQSLTLSILGRKVSLKVEGKYFIEGFGCTMFGEVKFILTLALFWLLLLYIAQTENRF